MSKSIKLQNNTYLDSSSIVHNKKSLKELLDDGNVYSTKEKRIGIWTDGKPLYEKTLITNTSFSGSVEISHGVSNYDKMWIDLSNSYYNAGKTNLPLIHNSYWGDFSQKTDAMVYNEKVLLYTDGGWGSDWEKVITLHYTKTTD